MTRPHLVIMEETEGCKGDNRENYDSTKESARDVIALNPDEGIEEGESDDKNDAGSRKGGKGRLQKSRDIQIPKVTIENPTPTPRVASGKERRKNADAEVDEDDDDDDDEDVDYDTGEEEEVEEEEEDTEMTQEEKQAMYETVKEGDIDALEDCLDLPNADINMTWFQENLLMAAMRAGHTEMAEFLVDNGVDHTHTTSRMSVRELPNGTKKFDRYNVDCRQMAFDCGLDDLVFLLDHLQGRLFPFVPAPKRTPRMRRPPPPSITPTDSNMDDEGNSSDADVSDTSSHQTPEDQNGDENKEKRKRKKKKSKTENKSMISSDRENCQSQGQGHEDEEVEEKDKTAWTGSTFTEVDSGNYSMVSGGKLKKSLVEKHNELLELDLDGKGASKAAVDNRSSKTNSPRKSNRSGLGSEKSRGKGSQKEQDGEQDGRTDTSRSKTFSTFFESSADLGPPLPVVPHPPNDPIRFNRSNMAVQKSDTLRRFYTTPLNESNLDSPLTWKKVYTTGSYVMESKNWHRDKNVNTTSSSKSDLERVAKTTTPGTITLSTGNEIKSKPLSSKSPHHHPSRAVSATLSAKSSLLPSPSLSIPSTYSSTPPSSSSSSSPRPATNPSRTTSSSSILKSSPTSGDNNKHIRFSPESSTKLDHRPSVASYMRPTQSTITKQRLYPRFVDSYGGLDFHHVTGRPQIFRLNLKPDHKPPDVKMTSSTPKPKSIPQRRNQNAISYRS